MNRVLPPENDEGWLGWHPSQTQRKEAERLLTDRAALGNPLVGVRFALPVSPGYHFEPGPGKDKTVMTANSNGDRPLPFSENDEKGLLCSQLREPANVWDICADRNIRPDAFYLPAHRILYSILLELSKDAQCIATDGKIDFVPLKRLLKDRGQLEEIGGEHWLSVLRLRSDCG
jgi:hypothetical protein